MTTKKPVLPERTLALTIRAGDRECFTWWPSAKHRCPYLATSGFGTRLHCALFGCAPQVELEPAKYDRRGNPVGALRCKECLEAEEKGQRR